MYKLFFSLILIFNMLILSSCSLGGSRTEMLNKKNDDNKADARLEEVIKSLKDKDKDTMKEIFSKQAQDDADVFDGNIDKLFDFFQGKVIKWEKSSGPTVSTSNNHGHKTKLVSSYYYVTTDKQKYFFLLDDYPVDTDHPDNVGLYLLLVVKAEDRLKIYDGDQKILFDGNKKISHSGIYLPLNNNNRLSFFTM